jgi:lipid A 3-O-deacylase
MTIRPHVLPLARCSVVLCAMHAASVHASTLGDATRFVFHPAAMTTLLHMNDDDPVPGSDAPTAVPPADLDAFAPAPAYGTQDSWRLYIHAGGGADATNLDNSVIQGGVGFEHFIGDDLSLSVELNGLFAAQGGPNAGGVNVNLLFRWHFLHPREEGWSLYFDGGAGLLVSTDEIPAGGSSFNFTPQAGLGATIDIGEQRRLMCGVRWLHVSNANTFEENPGRDHAYAYVGLSLPY